MVNLSFLDPPVPPEKLLLLLRALQNHTNPFKYELFNSAEPDFSYSNLFGPLPSPTLPTQAFFGPPRTRFYLHKLFEPPNPILPTQNCLDSPEPDFTYTNLFRTPEPDFSYTSYIV